MNLDHVKTIIIVSLWLNYEFYISVISHLFVHVYTVFENGTSLVS